MRARLLFALSTTTARLHHSAGTLIAGLHAYDVVPGGAAAKPSDEGEEGPSRRPRGFLTQRSPLPVGVLLSRRERPGVHGCRRSGSAHCRCVVAEGPLRDSNYHGATP